MGEKQALQALELFASLVNVLTDLQRDVHHLLGIVKAASTFVDSIDTSLEKIAKEIEGIRDEE